jgi:hypothetical protein
VTTLNTYLPPSRAKPFSHDDFAQAVQGEFEAVYGVDASGKGGNRGMAVYHVGEGGDIEKKVWDGVEELKVSMFSTLLRRGWKDARLEVCVQGMERDGSMESLDMDRIPEADDLTMTELGMAVRSDARIQ